LGSCVARACLPAEGEEFAVGCGQGVFELANLVTVSPP
jgi:hypothetical protein